MQANQHRRRKMTRALRHCVTAVVSLLIGGSLGFLFGSRTTQQAPKIMSQMYALGEYETLATLEYQQADAVHGKRALGGLLEFMKQIDLAQGNALGSSLDVDRGITYMRVALLEEREGNREKSQEYIRQAEDSFRERSGSTMSEADLRAVVAKQDARTRYALPGVFLLRQANR